MITVMMPTMTIVMMMMMTQLPVLLIKRVPATLRTPPAAALLTISITDRDSLMLYPTLPLMGTTLHLFASSFKLSFRLFADDTNIFISSDNSKQLETIINQELFKVKAWCKQTLDKFL